MIFLGSAGLEVRWGLDFSVCPFLDFSVCHEVEKS